MLDGKIIGKVHERTSIPRNEICKIFSTTIRSKDFWKRYDIDISVIAESMG